MWKQSAILKASPHTCYFFWKGSIPEHSIRIPKKVIEKKNLGPLFKRSSQRIKGLDLSFHTCSEKRFTLGRTLTKLVSRKMLRATGEYKKAVQDLTMYSFLPELE